MPVSVVFIWLMPATDENCAICATICVLSTGLNGSWFCNCAVISFRKSAWPSVVLPVAVDAATAVFAAAVPDVAMPRLDNVESKLEDEGIEVMVSGPS